MQGVTSFTPGRVGHLPRRRLRGLVTIAALALGSTLFSTQAQAVPIVISYADAAGTGFKDPTLGVLRRTALEALASNWSQRLGGTVPIEVRAHFEALGASGGGAVLAFASPTDLAENFPNAPIKDTEYPIALANQLAGTDLTPTGTAQDSAGNDITNDIDITFNSSLDTGALGPLKWYYGLDGNPPVVGPGSNGKFDTQIDFYSTGLHEMGHGLGFIALMSSGGALPTTGPAIFDQFLADGYQSSANRLSALTAAQRTTSLISGALYFAGANARATQGYASNVRLYAPDPYESGSSTSHLDEDTFHDFNELMTPISTGVIHDPGPVTTGIFRDMGWDIAESNPTPIPTPSTPPNTATNTIAFTTNRDGNSEIYTIDANGDNLARRTDNSAIDKQPALSPDGSHLTFVSDRDGNDEIYVLDLGPNSTNVPRRVTNSPGEDLHPSWSPDGRRIVFSTTRDGNSEIYKINADGTAPTRMTNNTFSDDQPSWSPVGRFGSFIAWVSNRDGNDEIYTMKDDGTVVRRRTTDVTSALRKDAQPAWSGDAGKIAFVSSLDGNAELFVMSYAGTGRVQLTDNFGTESSPSFNPGADQIAFSSDLFGPTNLYLMNADGTGLVRLTNGIVGVDTEPNWGFLGAVPPTPTPTATPTSTPTPTATPTPEATPINNQFADAALLSGNAGTLAQAPTAATNVRANKQSGEPNHAGISGGASVWYKWAAPENGTVSFNTGGSTFDTVLGVYTGSAVNALTTIAGNDDSTVATEAATKASRVTFSTRRNTVYYIAVDGFGGATGTVALNWSATTGPPNDNFANAEPIFGNAGSVGDAALGEETNVGATKETGEPMHAGNAGGASVWYQWTPDTNGDATVDLSGSTFDTLLAVYTGIDVGSLKLIASNDDANSGTNISQASWVAKQGTTYFIAVDGYGRATGNIVLNYSIAEHVPDMQVRNPTDTVYVGDNIYNTSGTQIKAQIPTPGSATKFYFRVQNDGNLADSYDLKGKISDFSKPAGSPDRFKVKYFSDDENGADITAQVLSTDGWPTGLIEPGSYRDIRLEVTVVGATPNGTVANFPFYAYSHGSSAGVDMAAAQVQVVTRQPDVQVRNNTDSSFIGNNIYEPLGSQPVQQIVSQSVNSTTPAVYWVRLQNDGSSADKFVLVGTGDDSNFTVRYQVGSNNLTTNFTNPAGQATSAFAPGSSVDIKVTVTPRSTASSGASLRVLVSAAAAIDRTRTDVAALVTSVGTVNNQGGNGNGAGVRLSNAVATGSTVTLTFSGALDSAVATDVSHYSLVAGNGAIDLLSANYSSVQQSVTLTLATALVNGDIATVRWRDLKDGAGQNLANGSTRVAAH